MPFRSAPAWLALVVTLGCSGKEFQGDGGESGEGGTAGSTGGSGPTGGMSGMGGMGGNSGMAGGGRGGTAGGGATGGMGGMPCTCAPTEYCRGGDCLACSELSTLEFGEPELMLDDPAGPIRFPRAGDTPSSLFYRSGAEGSGRLFYTPSTRAVGTFVGNPDVQQSGPLFVGALDRTFNVLYDQPNTMHRIMRAATWNGTSLGSETDMPSPLGPAGWDTYSIAAATALSPARLFWMSNRYGPTDVFTGLIDSGDGDDTVTIEVPQRNSSATCPRDNGD